MPQHGSYPICGPWQTSQFQKIMGRSFSANQTQSGCHPDCQSVKYSYTLSQVCIILCTLKCTLYSVKYTPYFVKYTLYSVKYTLCILFQAQFRRCDQRNLNYSPLCSLSPKFSPVLWQQPVKEIYDQMETPPDYIQSMEDVQRYFYPSDVARNREIVESYTYSQHKQTYNAFEKDIAVLHVYFGQPTATEFIRVVSLSWVGFLAQAGGLIGACLGFSFISLVEVVYWFIIRFCRLSKQEKKKEKLAKTEQSLANEANQEVIGDKMRSFEKLWCEGWESPCMVGDDIS